MQKTITTTDDFKTMFCMMGKRCSIPYFMPVCGISEINKYIDLFNFERTRKISSSEPAHSNIQQCFRSTIPFELNCVKKRVSKPVFIVIIFLLLLKWKSKPNTKYPNVLITHVLFYLFSKPLAATKNGTESSNSFEIHHVFCFLPKNCLTTM